MSDIIKKGEYTIIPDHVFGDEEYRRHYIILMFNYPIDQRAIETIAELGQEHIANCEVNITKRQGHTLLEFQLTRTSEIRQPVEEVQFFIEAENLNDVLTDWLKV